MLFHVRTFYSFLYGTSSPADVVAVAAALGHTALGLADINNTAGVLDFIKHCQQHHIRPFAGIEFRLRDGPMLYLGLANNATGYHNLCALFTHGSLAGQPHAPRAPYLDGVEWIYLRPDYEALAQPRPDEWCALRPHDLDLLAVRNNTKLLTRSVAYWPTSFVRPDQYKVHRLLRAIDQNRLINAIDENAAATEHEYMVSPELIERLFADVPAVVANTKALMERCSLDLDLDTNKTRNLFTSTHADDRALLRKLALEGFAYRYGKGTPHHRQRLEEELQVIDKLDFTAYYLIAYDMVRYAMSRQYYHVGRGSGANSIVAYCLRITDVDPIELDLYFERFINPHRTSPPDFDIDFSWDERDDVTDYLFKRYGRQYVGLMATFSTFQYRAAVREVGKAYGLPKADIDAIADRLADPQTKHALTPKVVTLAKQLIDLPQNFSIHAGGVLITNPPLNQYIALQQMPKGFPIAQMDMHIAEDYGFHKFDVLSQRGIGHIRDAVKLIKQNKGIDVDIHQVEKFKTDAKVIGQLRKAQTMGAFYIESPAMRQLLSKLNCDTYAKLVAASSIIRPGVSSSGMMRAYIERSLNPDMAEYPHPTFRHHLGETYGVMVYQEDVMKIAHHFGGLTLAEADVLRRAMSGKSRSREAFAALRDKFFANCQATGHPYELAAEVWRQMESFTGYSFCKAHSASFAVESFQSLYLKAYHPLEFMVAVINNFGGFYRTEAYVHEARMSGATIEAPCVNNSLYLTTINQTTIHLGFIHCLNLETSVGHAIVAERKANGSFASFADFMARVPVGREQLAILISIGAFRFTGQAKADLLWQKNAFLTPGKRATTPKMPQLTNLEQQVAVDTLPALTSHPLEEAFEQIEILGFPLVSPFLLADEAVPATIAATEMLANAKRSVAMVGYYVTRKPTRTTGGKAMAFATWVDVAGQLFDTTHFPEAFEKYPLRGFGIYLLEGRIDLDFGFPTLTVSRMRKLKPKPDVRF